MNDVSDARVAAATSQILTYLEGSFGALVMVGSGLLAILSAFLGVSVAVLYGAIWKGRNWKVFAACFGAPIFFLALAIGMFIVRSVIATFFSAEMP